MKAPAELPDARRLAAWLRPESLHLDVPLHDARHALEFVAAVVALRHGLDAGAVLRALWRREQAGSTALGAGFAVPHARIPGIARPLTVLVRTRRPIPFMAPDHEPVWLMLAILVPTDGDPEDHLQLLALVAELFSQPAFRAAVDTGADAAAVETTFCAALARLGDRPCGVRAEPGPATRPQNL